MSKAFKCDGCKKCFDPYAVEDNSYFTTIDSLVCQNGREFNHNEVGYRDDEIHLCPDCSQLLTQIFSGKVTDSESCEMYVEERMTDYEAGYQAGVLFGIALGNIIGDEPDESVCGGTHYDGSTSCECQTLERPKRSKKNSKRGSSV